MSRRSEDVESGQRPFASKRPDGRDSDDEDDIEERKGSPSRFCRERSKSYYSVDVSKENETGQCVDTRQGSASLTLSNIPIGHSQITLPDRTEVVISSDAVEETFQGIDLIRVPSPAIDETPVESRIRIDTVAGSPSHPGEIDRASEGISTLGPLPENLSSARPQEQIHFDRIQPPSYTSVEIRRPSIPFVAPAPPPSYGEVMGIESLRSPRPPPLILNVAPSVWSHRAQPAYCRNCHAVVISKIRHIPCTFTHMAAALLFLFLCWPFCFVPYCVNYCQQARHHCPGCNQLLGTYSPTV